MVNGVEGIKRLMDRTRQLPEDAREQMRIANENNAKEFMAKVASIIPTEEGQLAATLEMKKTDNDTGYEVSVGGPAAPYPLHVEAGHMAANGKKVEAKPFWNPAKRVLKKRAASRANRALNKVVKDATSGA